VQQEPGTSDRLPRVWTPALASVLVALGLTGRDGVWLAVGTLVAAGSLGLIAGIAGSIGLAADRMLG